MSRSIPTSLAFWISAAILVSGCTNRAPSLRMLDTRAGYGSDYDDEEVALYQRHRAEGDQIGRPMGPRIAKVYVYPHELPSQDYFWGGYVSLIVHRDEVVFDPPTEDMDGAGDRVSNAQAAPIRHARPRKGVTATTGETP